MMTSLSESFIDIGGVDQSNNSSRTSKGGGDGGNNNSSSDGGMRRRSLYQILTLFAVTFAGAWTIYHYQAQVLPKPLTVEEAGRGGFSEEEAFKHVKALTQWGPHTLASDALELALQYVLNVSEEIKETANEDFEVEVDFFSPNSGINRPVSGRYKSKTLVYSDLHHVVLRISPKYLSSSLKEDAKETAILVSAHVDTVFSAEGAGDDSSNVAVMLELARGISQSAHGLKHAVIFLFNTAEEEGLDGSHSFVTQEAICKGVLHTITVALVTKIFALKIKREMNPCYDVLDSTQEFIKSMASTSHPWRHTLKLAINLEAMGVGGKSGIFQVGPHPWAIENFAKTAKYPSGHIAAQDVFSSGLIQSSTDFEVYKEVAGLSGLDFAFEDNTAVYHTKNDKIQLLTPGSLQHLGENLLPFLLQAASSTDLPEGMIMNSNHESAEETAIFFDILGKYMIVFRLHYAEIVYESAILLSILIWATSVLMGGVPAVTSFFLSFLGLILMWLGSIASSGVVAFILSSISKSPVPFVASPWLVLGLYGAPALIGALMGQHVGFLLLRSYLTSTVKITIAELESERWVFKAGFLQWLILLILGNHFQIGSTYLALVWLVSPALTYFLIEVRLSPEQSPRPLNPLTLLVGLFLPFLLTSGVVFRLTSTVIGYSVRYDSNPGSTPEWMIHILVAVVIAAFVCLTLAHLLSYIHISGAKAAILVTSLVLFGLSVTAVFTGLVPAFTEETSRAVNLVHVIDGRGQEPHSFISLFSSTPGKLDKVAEGIGGMSCGKDKTIDFVTLSVTYSCWSDDEVVLKSYKEESLSPQLLVQHHIKDTAITQVVVDTKSSTRWALGINTDEVKDIQLTDDSGILIPKSGISGKDGWHIIQFAGGKNSPTKFNLTLFRVQHEGGASKKQEQEQEQETEAEAEAEAEAEHHLLKMRTDYDIATEGFKQLFSKLPSWCSQYGKSIFPHTLAVLTSLPVP